jgi:hypothetical protein
MPLIEDVFNQLGHSKWFSMFDLQSWFCQISNWIIITKNASHQLKTFNIHLLIIATLVLGSQPRQRGYKVAGQEEARESHHILPRMYESVKEYEGVNLHTPKATPTLGDGIPVDFRNFRERF